MKYLYTVKKLRKRKIKIRNDTGSQSRDILVTIKFSIYINDKLKVEAYNVDVALYQKF